MGTKKKPRRERTIARELHNEWQKLERKNDSKLIAEELGVSKPTIDNALIYGHVNQQRIVDGITKYFADRLTREREDASKLNKLGHDLEPISAEQPA